MLSNIPTGREGSVSVATPFIIGIKESKLSPSLKTTCPVHDEGESVA